MDTPATGCDRPPWRHGCRDRLIQSCSSTRLRVRWRPRSRVRLARCCPAWELKSLAVTDRHRQHSLGRRLVEAGLAHAREHGATRVVLATAAADTGVLRFYQRLGFRLLRIERDVFTPAAGYPAELFVDGIRLRDRAWLDFLW